MAINKSFNKLELLKLHFTAVSLILIALDITVKTTDQDSNNKNFIFAYVRCTLSFNELYGFLLERSNLIGLQFFCSGTKLLVLIPNHQRALVGLRPTNKIATS